MRRASVPALVIAAVVIYAGIALVGILEFVGAAVNRSAVDPRWLWSIGLSLCTLLVAPFATGRAVRRFGVARTVAGLCAPMLVTIALIGTRTIGDERRAAAIERVEQGMTLGYVSDEPHVLADGRTDGIVFRYRFSAPSNRIRTYIRETMSFNDAPYCTSPVGDPAAPESMKVQRALLDERARIVSPEPIELARDTAVSVQPSAAHEVEILKRLGGCEPVALPRGDVSFAVAEGSAQHLSGSIVLTFYDERLRRDFLRELPFTTQRAYPLAAIYAGQQCRPTYFCTAASRL